MYTHGAQAPLLVPAQNRRRSPITAPRPGYRTDVLVMHPLLERERQMRRDEVAIDLEDRSTKKGTPPQPSEAGDLRLLHAGRDQQGRESPIEATSAAMLTE